MKIRAFAVAVLFVGILTVSGFGSLALPDKAVSVSERRYLTRYSSYAAQKREAEDRGRDYGITDYFAFLETYCLDQFPGRELLRSIKSVFKLKVLLQKDNNGYYCVDGSLSRMDPVLNETAVTDAVDRLNAVYETLLRPLGANAFYCLIPDKNYFLAQENGYLHYDYDALYRMVGGQIRGDIREIDVRALLSADAYYRTDPHWDQAALLPAAQAVLRGMGASGGISGLDWQTRALEPFYGTYWGQLALPVAPDTLRCLTCSRLENVSVYDHAAQRTTALYQEEGFGDVDPYDVFLGGAVSLLKLENPDGATDRQLVVFRDSFGSSLIPLLAAEYSEIIAADLRYLSVDGLRAAVRLRPDCDVLFLYSTSVLNTYGAFTG